MPSNKLALCSCIVLLSVNSELHSEPAHSGLAAAADSADTLYMNPAGLVRLKDPQLAVQLIAGYSESEFSVGASSTNVEGSTDSDGSLAIPSIYYAFPLNDNWTAGVSFNVPGGIGSDFGESWVGRYFVQDWTLAYVGFTGALGYQVNEKLSLGFGLNANYVGYEVNSAVRNPEPDVGDGQMEIKASDIGVGYTLGVLYQLTDRTRFGVTYHAEVDSEVEGEPDFSGLGPIRQQSVRASGLESRDVSIDVTSPQSLLIGIHQQWDDEWEWVADVLWFDFSEFGFSQVSLGDSSVNVDGTEYDDIFMLSTAVTFPIAEKWRSGVGALYASSGVDDDNRSFMLRLDRVFGAGVGFEYEWSETKTLEFGFNYFDLGDAPVSSQELPLIGSLEGEFEDNRAITIDIALHWRR